MNNTENTAIKLHAESNTHPFAPKDEHLEQLVEYYTETKKLPTQYVTCTRSGKQVTMFGDNLRNRVAKYGGIRELLTLFICKEAMAADKAKGIIHTDQPAHSGTRTRHKKQMSEVEIREQIRQLEAQLQSAAVKAEVTVAEAEVKVEEPKAKATAAKK